jgi:1-acyl-sn-glycerol-3-phosphate acyltransferase
VLERGELFGIYPEGTRSRTGLLHKGHTGAARLALRTGAPILPVGLVGTREVQPPDAKLPQPFRPVWVRIGRPVHPGKDPERMGDHRLLRQITDEVMFEIGALSGQTYVDEYANKKPDEVAIPRQRGGVITASGANGNGTTPVTEVAKAS